MATLAKIRRLYFRYKLSIREISRQTGMSRNTVCNWLREPDMIEPKCPVRVVATKLDAYADTLRQWLKADTDAANASGAPKTKCGKHYAS